MNRLPHLDQSTAALRIKGDDLDPDEISRTLGCEPSYGFRKGQIDIGKKKAKKSNVRAAFGYSMPKTERLRT
jgi:hypothetical protein